MAERTGDVGGWDVSVPVTVYIENGEIVAAEVDYEGAPWPFVTSGGNVWDPLTEEWESHEDIAARADIWVAGVLDEQGLPGTSLRE